MSTTSIAVVGSNPLGSIQKYLNLAANAAIAVQQVASDAPNETKLGLALNFVNVGLGVAAEVNPALTPILSLAAGLESPMAGLISSCVQLFKAHNVHGFTSSKAAPAKPAPVAIAQAAATTAAAAQPAWDEQAIPVGVGG
jgi:hypothetical protein